jgi:hypothetical protein
LHLKEIFSQYSVLFKELKKGEGEWTYLRVIARN